MKCRDAKNFIQLEIDGLLSPENSRDLDSHLAACPDCAKEQENALALHAFLTDNLQLIDAPLDFTAQVMASLPKKDFRTDKASEKASLLARFRKSGAWVRYGLTAAVLALVIGAISLYSLGGPSNDPPSINVAHPDPAVIEPADPDQDDPPSVIPDDTLTQPSEDDPIDNSDDPKVSSPPIYIADAGNPNTVNNPNADDPAIDPANIDDSGQSGELYLPKPLYGTDLQGAFSLKLIADHGRKAIKPVITSSGYVEYLVDSSGYFETWRQSLSADSEPELLSGNQSEAGATENSGKSEVTWTDEDSLNGSIAISPDRSMVAANYKGENGGLWISDNNSDAEPSVLTKKAGGALLQWSPNSGKIAYTDSKGFLWVAYPAEKLTLNIGFDGVVSSVAWASDSSTLVFSGVLNGDEYSKIYSVILP